MSILLPFSPDDIDAVLFDMDGTLINTDDADVSRWARRMAHIYPTPEKAQDAARRLVMSLETPVNALLTLLDWFGLDALVMRVWTAGRVGGRACEIIPPINGVGGMIRQLAPQYRLAVVSTRTVPESEQFLRMLGVREHFGAIAGRDTTWRIKPHPQPVWYVASQLGVDPGRCLMVGDTTVDITAGRRAGARTCGVLCGYGERSELERAGADLILPHTALLADLLNRR